MTVGYWLASKECFISYLVNNLKYGFAVAATNCYIRVNASTYLNVESIPGHKFNGKADNIAAKKDRKALY